MQVTQNLLQDVCFPVRKDLVLLCADVRELSEQEYSRQRETKHTFAYDAGSILFEDRDYARAERVFGRNGFPTYASHAAREMNDLQTARKHLYAFVIQPDWHSYLSFLVEAFDARAAFAKGELGSLVHCLRVRHIPASRKDDIAMILDAFIGRMQGNKGQVKMLYDRSKRTVTRASHAKIPDDPEAAENSWYWNQHVSSTHADLCIALGKWDEAIDCMRTDDGLKSNLLRHRGLFLPHIEKRKDKHRIYEDILREECHQDHPDYWVAGLASERFDRNKGIFKDIGETYPDAKELFEKGLAEAEEHGKLFDTYRFAQKLGLEQKTEKLVALSRELVEKEIV